MQIILNQKEIEAAVEAMILERITIPEDQPVIVSIDYSDDNGITAAIVIGETVANIVDIPSEDLDEAPVKKTRGRRKKAEAGEETQIEITGGYAPKILPFDMNGLAEPETTQSLNISTTPEDRREPEEGTPDCAGPNVAPESEPVETQPAPIQVTSAPKIFPDAVSSAPVTQPAPTAAPTAKSLFANLTKPVNA